MPGGKDSDSRVLAGEATGHATGRTASFRVLRRPTVTLHGRNPRHWRFHGRHGSDHCRSAGITGELSAHRYCPAHSARILQSICRTPERPLRHRSARGGRRGHAAFRPGVGRARRPAHATQKERGTLFGRREDRPTRLLSTALGGCLIQFRGRSGRFGGDRGAS